jgi:ribosomal protein S18 acetylase RimI-like enzyme
VTSPSTSPARTARLATQADGDRLSETLMRAFMSDPLIAYFFPDLATREPRLRRMFKILFTWGEPYGACHVTPNFEAAILWRPPNEFHIPYWQYVTNGFELLGIFGSNALNVTLAMNQIESAHPKPPNYYLQAVGTDPDMQGKGWGGVVIRHQLALADAEGIPCYLESSKDTNIPIYERLGFKVTGEITIPARGRSKEVTIWPMWRDIPGAELT